jgi:uncharacterized protein YciI
MQHFIVIITYRVPDDELGDATVEHRAYLAQGYARRLLLCSGPQVPRTGGIVVARAESRDKLVQFFATDPYQVRGLADYTFIEFNPVFKQDFLADWIAG